MTWWALVAWFQSRLPAGLPCLTSVPFLFGPFFPLHSSVFQSPLDMSSRMPPSQLWSVSPVSVFLALSFHLEDYIISVTNAIGPVLSRPSSELHSGEPDYSWAELSIHTAPAHLKSDASLLLLHWQLYNLFTVGTWEGQGLWKGKCQMPGFQQPTVGIIRSF